MSQQPLNLEERKRILNQQLAKYTRQGFRVVSQTDTTAQLMKPKKFSFIWALLWFLMLGVGLLVYIFYYLSKKDAIIFIDVDEFGRVHKR